MAGRIENLKPWPKGVSGNPGGRPKRDMSSEIAKAVFEQNPEAVYWAMLKTLLKGNPRAFAVLADRAYGKVGQQENGHSLVGLAENLAAIRKRKHAETLAERMEAAQKRYVESLTDEELQCRIEQLETQLGYRKALRGQTPEDPGRPQ